MVSTVLFTCKLSKLLSVAAPFWYPTEPRDACLHHYRLIRLIMTLNFDLWPWKPYQQCPHVCLIFVASFIQICLLSTKFASRKCRF